VNRCRRWLAAVALLVVAPASATADAKWQTLYGEAVLVREQPRLEGKIRELYGILTTLMSPPEAAALAGIAFEHPLRSDAPLNFFARRTPGGPRITMPVQALLFVEELCIAYAWLQQNGYSLETIDEYISMLTFRPARDFPGGTLPPPLAALGVPAHATADRVVDGLSLRLRNSAYAFILGHELGHIVRGHGGYAGISTQRARADEAEADAFALGLLQRAQTIPMGAILFFQAQAYALPNPGQFQAVGLSMQDWEREVQRAITHPLAADRLRAIAVGVDNAAASWSRPGERPILRFIAENLAVIGGYLDDIDLQHCVAVAATRTELADLQPRRRGAAGFFLGKCVKR
jgi:hypothetical protein